MQSKHEKNNIKEINFAKINRLVKAKALANNILLKNIVKLYLKPKGKEKLFELPRNPW